MNHWRRDEMANKLSKPGYRSQPEKIIAGVCVLAIGQSLLRWHDSYSGFYLELGKSLADAKWKAQVKNNVHKAE